MSNSTVSNKDRVVCKKCKSLTVITFKFCQNCGIEKSSLISAPVSRTCTSFNDLDFNIITLVTTFIHSKYEPLKAYFSDNIYTAEKLNAEDVELGVLFLLNTHYRRYKAKNYFFYLNEEYSLKYYSNDNNFSLKMNIDNPLKQLGLVLEEEDIEDVSVLGSVNNLNLSKNSRVKDVSALGSVHTLYLDGCTGITDVRALGSVHTLELERCTGITDVSALGSVHTLSLSGCTGITDVSALGSVYDLNLLGCTGITDVSALGSVHTLELKGCTGTTAIRDLAGVNSLDISNCVRIVEVTNLSSVTSINATGCLKLKVLRNLPKLKSLCVSGCAKLEKLSYVSDDLCDVDLRDCKKLKVIQFYKRKLTIR